MTRKKFERQREYFAVSVSTSVLDKVREYIKNQEEHHQTRIFQEEYDEIISNHNFNVYKE